VQNTEPRQRVAAVGIVGGGPVGLTLALFLDRSGVPCVLFNTEAATRWHPKGSSESARSMELFRQLGLAERIRALGLPEDHPTDVAYFTRFNAHELARLSMPSRAEVLRRRREAPKTDQVPEPIHRANQMHVDRLLFDHAATRPHITCRFGWQVEQFEQDTDGVAVTAANAAEGASECWRVQYLVGCDGGRSFVRRNLGIRFSGEAALEDRYFGGRMFSTYIRSPELYRDVLKPRRAWQYWAVNPELRSTIISVNGGDEFLFRTKAAAPNQPADDATVTLVLHCCSGAKPRIEILGHEPWTAGTALVAETFGDRRVLLAGDAVHLFTPTGGFGMNTGLEDAANLAWKLAACIQGWGGPALLASYEQERLPIALRNTGAARQLSININDVEAPPEIEMDSAAGQNVRRTASTKLATFAEQFASLGVQLGGRYDNSSIIVADAAPPADDFITYRPTSIPGGRAPHAWLDEEHGDGGSLYDRLGTGMTLLRLGHRPPDARAMAGAARARGIPLSVVDIDDSEIRDLYDCDLAIIRPDHYVAWRGNGVPADAEALLAQLVGAKADALPQGDSIGSRIQGSANPDAL
jgi:2-polyprenyl-6-methoxyphenol hydroxylase-like FAD-dependent oxidoreductase